MTPDKALTRLKQLGNALQRMEEAIGLPHSDVRTDVLIQRFEFTTELFWKTLKAVLEMYGVDAPFPKIQLQEAYKAGWIKDDALWIKILTDRNTSSHVYDEATVREIAGRIPEYRDAMRDLYETLARIIASYSKA
ncbi:MAG TPA: HI0074 family nucleotidyltransferase substrate-binding subunit [Alphaproteobacteria bacterium]|nr:HI0074 family nucleotidyltransferase substrate-binding subunit [Alphaproteobacteria bacterium]